MKNSIYLILILTIIWTILTENLTFWSIGTGHIISIICVYICGKLLRFDKISNINYWRLFLYVFYLIGQIYIAGIAAIKLIIKGAKTDIVVIHTEIDNDFLKVLLANSITLTPGTLTLELKDDRLTVLWLRDKKSGSQDTENADELIKGKLEKQLLKASKK